MKIAHVARIENTYSNGLSNIVEKYAAYQKKYADTLLLDLADEKESSVPDDTDLVVFHGVYDIKLLDFFENNVKGKYKYVFVPHGGLTKVSQKKSRLKKKFANLFLFSDFYKNAEAIQFVSEYEKDHSISLKCKKRIVCPSGIEIPETIKYTPKNRDEFIITFVGRLDMYYKGIDIFLKALYIIKDYLKENNIKIQVFGVCRDKTSVPAEKRLIEKYKLADVLEFDDSGVFGIEKERIILNADYFIQTSRSEGLPVGVLEVLSWGVPVLLTDPVGFGRLINKYNCGFHCKCAPNAIAEMIKKAYENKKYLGKFSNNSFIAANEFSWDNATKITLEHYRNL